jgi:5,10-methylenetetrahydrofolate reductase
MEAKVKAGARFFITQAVYDAATFETFMADTSRLGVPVIACHIVLKSGDMARRINRTLPGVSIPDALVAELDAALDPVATSIAISGRVLSGLKDLCQGLHVIAAGWESRLPAILEAAGIR